MNSDHISLNLRKLRTGKNMTQQQFADLLGVSVQSVSRWECANTFPDVSLLPEIAKIYGVTIDDLFRENIQGYPNYAQRLLAVYEASGKPEDFWAAEQAFSQIPTQELTADDQRSWGVLYHYMMKYAASQAQHKLQQAMQFPEVPDSVFCSAAQQRLALLCDQGKGTEETQRCNKRLEADAADVKNWILCVAAHAFSGETETALSLAQQAIDRFPDCPALYIHAGDLYKTLRRYDEAFLYWEKAWMLDDTYLDALYSMGFCYEELGRYHEAYGIWIKLVAKLDNMGLTIDRQYPQSRAALCASKMEQG